MVKVRFREGIRELRSAKDILQGLIDEINRGTLSSPDKIPDRITTIQDALGNAKMHFTGELE